MVKKKSHKKKWLSGRPPERPTSKRRGPVGTAYKVTQDARANFLAGLADGLSVAGAAARIRVTREHMFRLRREEQAAHEAAGGTGLCEFAANWEAAVETGTDLLEDAVDTRVRHGYVRPIFQGGRRVGYERVYSDSLAGLMLKARRPEKFKDRQEVTGKDGAALVPPAPPPLVVNFTKTDKTDKADKTEPEDEK